MLAASEKRLTMSCRASSVWARGAQPSANNSSVKSSSTVSVRARRRGRRRDASSKDTVSNNLDNRLCKASSSFGKIVGAWQSHAPPLHEDPGIQSRRCSNPPVRCRDLSSLPEADKATRAVSPTLLALNPWHQMARPRVERRSPQESQPAQHGVQLASGAAALGKPRHKEGLSLIHI